MIELENGIALEIYQLFSLFSLSPLELLLLFISLISHHFADAQIIARIVPASKTKIILVTILNYYSFKWANQRFDEWKSLNVLNGISLLFKKKWRGEKTNENQKHANEKCIESEWKDNGDRPLQYSWKKKPFDDYQWWLVCWKFFQHKLYIYLHIFIIKEFFFSFSLAFLRPQNGFGYLWT